MKISILGAGGWGTALATIVHANGHDVTLWGRDPAQLGQIAVTRRNETYLPGIELPASLSLQPDAAAAVAGADCVVLAVPSKAFREVARGLATFAGIVVSVTKGIEFESGKTMSAILREAAPAAGISALSGPSLALEVARGVPAAVVAASEDLAVAKAVQDIFHRPAFRVYSSGDLLGVELGGALKNVMAIAAGVCDGLGFGDNTKAALVTRAVVEMRRLGVACSALPETFSGLSGLGDLTVTCFSRLSRNRSFGERIGRGEKPEAILASVPTVAEGYPTARSAYRLARGLGVATPIIDEVHAMLYEGKDVRKAVRDITTRDSKAEGE